jgi:hypothetical protein
MKQLPNIIAALLGLAFLLFGINFFFPFLPPLPKPEAGSPPAMFFGSIYMTGFLGFVKSLEIIGALLVVIPKTRNWGLLVLGPIVIGIIAVNVYIKGGSAVLDPALIAVSVFSAYLLWDARAKFIGLLNK